MVSPGNWWWKLVSEQKRLVPGIAAITLAAILGVFIRIESAVKAGSEVAKGIESNPADDLIVHEWGTFTTFSGSDGVFMDYRPLAYGQHDLPNFVRDRAFSDPEVAFFKARIRGKVRMETPVTYFYTQTERTVKAKVRFPEGLLTEFYPPVRTMEPPFDSSSAFTTGEKMGNSSLDWGEIRLIPPHKFAPSVDDPATRDWLTGRIHETILPVDDHGHYAQARATDSAFVHLVSKRPLPENRGELAEHHLEKFLFYRGVGKFALPVQGIPIDDSIVRFTNNGPDEIRSLLAIRVDGDAIQISHSQPAKSGETVRLNANKHVSVDQLSDVIKTILTEQGLYEKESAAMVQTWRDQWFQEQGTRVLYIVPEKLTNELLPLEIDPKPVSTVRVLVGRMEIMPESIEKSVSRLVAEHLEFRRQMAEKNPEAPIDQQVNNDILDHIRRLGRMAEPCLTRIQTIASDEAVRTEAQFLTTKL